MLHATLTHSLLGQSNYAICLVRPSGDLLYANSRARSLLHLGAGASQSLLSALLVPSTWTDLVARISNREHISDEPVLLSSTTEDSELSFLTLLPQRNAEGGIDSLLCIFAARRNALADHPDTLGSDGIDEYTRDLEAILEHRTYRQMILGDLLEHSRKTLDILSIGVLIADPTGRITYVNQALSDTFGFHRSEMAEPNIRYLLSPEQLTPFERVLTTGFRDICDTVDNSGHALTLEFLPLIEGDAVASVVIQYSHPAHSCERA